MNRLLVISALWCPSCLIIKKHIKKIKEEYNNLDIKELDYDFDEEEVKDLNIGEVLPVMIAFDKGEEKSRLIGEKNYDEIINFLKENSLI